MKIHLIFTTVFIACFAFCSTPLIKAQTSQNTTPSVNNWIGEYEFFDSPKTARRNTPTPSVVYKITVYEKNNQLLAELEADGFQMGVHYQCTVKIIGSAMNLYFLKDLIGNGADEFTPLKKGNFVASLKQTQSGNKRRYLFKPGGYEIYLMSGKKGTPIYFTKTNNE